MTTVELEHLLEQLRTALEDNKVDQAINILESLRTPDQADLISELDEADQVTLLSQLDPDDSADILEELEDEDAADLVSALDPDTAAEILDEMEPDEAADVLAEMEDEDVQRLLSEMDDPEEVHPLLLHPEDSAGGLMTAGFIVLRRRMTASEAIKAMQELDPEDEVLSDLYVVDQANRLVGVVDLRVLIRANPQALIGDIMNKEVISVQVGTDQEEVARIMSRYDLLSVPVVDENGKLLGLITIDDVVDVLEEEATEDIQRLGGAEPLDEPYLSSKVTHVTRKRIGWLLLLFLTGSLTGTVMRIFENELTTTVALSYFIPLLIGTGGNAGSQTTSTVIRALAVGDISLKDGLHALWHELRVGLLLGAGMGIFAFIRAITWNDNPWLAATVSIAILTIVIWANILGSVLPLLAAKLKIDPTVVSGPVMSTLVDATGLFIYFTIARVLLGL